MPDSSDRLDVHLTGSSNAASKPVREAGASVAAAVDCAAWRHELTLHPPAGPAVAAAMDAVRTAYIQLGYLVISRCPPSRERSLALTNLRQSSMWAIGAIACGPDNQPPTANDTETGSADV